MKETSKKANSTMSIEIPKFLNAFLIADEVQLEEGSLSIIGARDCITVPKFPYRFKATLLFSWLGLEQGPRFGRIRVKTPGYRKATEVEIKVHPAGDPRFPYIRKFELVLPLAEPGLARFSLSLDNNDYGPFIFPVRQEGQLLTKVFDVGRRAGRTQLQALLFCDSIESRLEGGDLRFDILDVSSGLFCDHFPVKVPFHLVTVWNTFKGEHSWRIIYPDGSAHGKDRQTASPGEYVYFNCSPVNFGFRKQGIFESRISVDGVEVGRHTMPILPVG
jgi:hypothetical protein